MRSPLPQGRSPAPVRATVQPVVVPGDTIPDRRGIVGFLSQTTREGDWILPRSFRVVAALGDVQLDLTSVVIGTGTSEIEIVAFMGNVVVLVPPGLRIECEVDTMLGSFEVERHVVGNAPLDAPTVRIVGSSILSSVEVRIIDPNAPGFMEKLRNRWESLGD